MLHMPEENASDSVVPAPLADATEILETAPETIAILQLFDQMDAAAPLMRLIIAASIVGISLLLLLISKVVIRRRTRRPEATPDGEFSPLRWQAPDGGYWLVGVRDIAMLPGLFAGVRWSSADALADTLVNIPGHRRVAMVDTLADIDDGAALAHWRARAE